MNHTTHSTHRHTALPDADHQMPEIHGRHDRHAGHSVVMFRDKFWLSLALTIPVVAWSTDVQHWLGYTAPSFPGSKFDTNIYSSSNWPWATRPRFPPAVIRETGARYPRADTPFPFSCNSGQCSPRPRTEAK